MGRAQRSALGFGHIGSQNTAAVKPEKVRSARYKGSALAEPQAWLCITPATPAAERDRWPQSGSHRPPSGAPSRPSPARHSTRQRPCRQATFDAMGNAFLPLHGLSLTSIQHAISLIPMNPPAFPIKTGSAASVEAARSRPSRAIASERFLTVARALRSRKGACSVRYAKSRGKRPTAEICAFELRDGWRRPLAHTVRSDPPASQK